MVINAVEISESEKIFEILKGAIQLGLGAEPRIGGMIGTNDARFFIKKGIPAIICGPGITTQSHGVDEYVEIGSIVNAAKAYALTMVRFCK